jgi:hypothetical protein
LPSFFAIVFTLSLLLSACSSVSPVYPPPHQRATPEHAVLNRRTPLIDMSDGAVERHIVQDISLGATDSSWRWTGKRPTVKFDLKDTAGFTYRADFAIPGVTFKETGPVSITFFIDDAKLATVRYDTPGAKVFEAPVPPKLLRESPEHTAAAEIDKVFIAKEDGARLGFILSRLGLQR